MPETSDHCKALDIRIDALEKMLDEREERTKERFVAVDRSVSTALLTSDKAVTKAEAAIEKRFEGVNEFRASLADQAAILMPRSEYSVQHITLQDRVAGLERRIGTVEDRGFGKQAGLSATGQIVLGIIAATAALAAVVGAFGHLLR